MLPFLILCLGQSVSAAQADYPRANLLIEPAELARPEIREEHIILDARSREAYEQEHVPGALWVDHSIWAKTFGDGKDPEEWSRQIGQLGIDADAQVVVYDDNLAKDAARIWWILRYWGVENTKLLNGGWAGWTAGDFAVEGKPPSPPKTVAFTAAPREERLATKQEVLSSLNEQELQLVDARSEGEYCGLTPLSNARAGAIPGARNLEWSDLLDSQTQRFKPADDLRQLFQEAGVDLDKPAATHCQSGGRASVMAFGLELMGAEEVSNYYQGWSEWGNADDTPVVPGKPSD